MQTLICLLLLAFLIALAARIVMSWIPMAADGAWNTVARFVVTVTEPVLGPLRRALPPVRAGNVGIDLSPTIVFFAIFILQGILC